VTSAEPIILSELPAGFRGVVARVTGGRDLAARLAAMGLTAGTEIVVLQNLGFGPMLARVRDTRIALGRGQAGMVTVYECESADARPVPRPAAPR
jgi:ferrous iron transport protein A